MIVTLIKNKLNYRNSLLEKKIKMKSVTKTMLSFFGFRKKVNSNDNLTEKDVSILKLFLVHLYDSNSINQMNVI